MKETYMKKILKGATKKIAVFRALQLGDLLCAIPAIRALKKSYPDAEITLLGLPWAKEFVQRFNHYFSGFIHFPGYPGLPEQEFDHRKFISFLKKTNAVNFDLAIQMHGNGSIINPMMTMLGAAKTAGFCEENRYRPDEKFMIYPEECPEIERHLRLMSFLGIPSDGDHLELPVTVKEESDFNALSKAYSLFPGQYICIHPGARDLRRWWSPQKFGQAADHLAEKGYTIVITGTESERETTTLVTDAMSYPFINLAGITNLGTLTLLIKGAKMLLSNDTGVSHIASATKTPSVIVFLASDPKRWAPLNKERHHIILREESDNMDDVLEKIWKALASGHLNECTIEKAI
jgi:ADP-heptose:LPS heptosyltransferase